MVIAVADHQPPAVLIEMLGELLDTVGHVIDTPGRLVRNAVGDLAGERQLLGAAELRLLELRALESDARDQQRDREADAGQGPAGEGVAQPDPLRQPVSTNQSRPAAPLAPSSAIEVRGAPAGRAQLEVTHLGDVATVTVGHEPRLGVAGHDNDDDTAAIWPQRQPAHARRRSAAVR